MAHFWTASRLSDWFHEDIVLHWCTILKYRLYDCRNEIGDYYTNQLFWVVLRNITL